MNATEHNAAIYQTVAGSTSRLVTRRYSTSFSLSILFLERSLREAIYAIYGFVRLADEVVDTFTGYPGEELLKDLRRDTFLAIERGISTNPILHNFQQTANRYGIESHLITAFLDSMQMDLKLRNHERVSYENYIYGSAEAVGLMCLHVFCDGDRELYERLKPYAMHLGAAFQKVNFLRDMNQDTRELNRNYFPHMEGSELTPETKQAIEREIEEDFRVAYQGIRMLPAKARFGVYLAYVYYTHLFAKIKQVPAERVASERIRVGNMTKSYLLLKSMLRHKVSSRM